MPGEPEGRDFAAYASPSLLPVTATMLALRSIRGRRRDHSEDAGCGAGLLTHPSAAAAGETGAAYSVDPTRPAGVRPRPPRLPRPLGRGGAEGRLPFADGDLAHKVLCAASGTLPDLPVALAEWCRVLGPGGRVVLAAWDPALDLPAALAAAGLRVQRERGTRAADVRLGGGVRALAGLVGGRRGCAAG